MGRNPALHDSPLMQRLREFHPESDPALPPGTPAWITPELVQLTLTTWQPFYEARLSVADAVRILVGTGRLFGVLSGG